MIERLPHRLVFCNGKISVKYVLLDNVEYVLLNQQVLHHCQDITSVVTMPREIWMSLNSDQLYFYINYKGKFVIL